MKLRQLFEATETVGIIFGRFNPPHQGHKAAWEEAAKNTHWYVGTNKSTIGPKDPLPFDIKIQAMETIWPEIKGHIIAEQTWWSLATAVYKKHGEIDLKIITDETDAKVFVPGLQKSNGVESKHGYYKFKSIEWQQAPRVSSATELRAAVANDDPKKFAKAAGVPADTIVAGEPFFDLVKYYLGKQVKEDASLEEAQTGDVYVRFKVKPPLDKKKGKPTLMAFAGFANTPAELTLDNSKMNFNVLTKKQDIVNAIKKIIGDKIFIGAEKVVIYNDGAVNPKKFPQYGEFLAWVDQYGKEKVKIVNKPDSDDEEGEKGSGKKRLPKGHAASGDKNYLNPELETTKYFSIDNPRLMKFLRTKAPQIMSSFRPNLNLFVMDQNQYRTFRKWMASEPVVSKFGETNVRIDKEKTFSHEKGRKFEDASPEEEDEFHVALDKLVHKYFGHSSDEKKKKKKEVDEAAPVAAVYWILRWVAMRGAWPLLKFLLKRFGKKIAVGGAAIAAIDEGWDWVKNKIGEEYTQMLIDNKFEIGMAVALVMGAVAIKRWMEKHGEKLADKYAESLETGDLSWMN